MSCRRASACLAVAVALLPSCAQIDPYDIARMEFDSATGFDPIGGEPTELEFRDEALRWPWYVRVCSLFGIDQAVAALSGVRPTLLPIDNPSGFVRERIQDMTADAADDLGRMADVAQRALWIVAIDPHSLDQVTALGAIEDLLRWMRVDPLAVPSPADDPIAGDARVERELERLVRHAPARRGDQPLSDLERRGRLAALAAVSERPAANGRLGRRVVHELLAATAAETDPTLVQATRQALADALACELAHAMRVELASTDPLVRENALLALVRVSGPMAVPFSLRLLAATRPGERRSYDPSSSFRRAWVRLCAQLPRSFVFESYAGGPRPIEYLYDTATADEDEGLRLLALDAMARALHQPLSFDRDQADEWWREYSLGGPPERVGSSAEGSGG